MTNKFCLATVAKKKTILNEAKIGSTIDIPVSHCMSITITEGYVWELPAHENLKLCFPPKKKMVNRLGLSNL